MLTSALWLNGESPNLNRINRLEREREGVNDEESAEEHKPQTDEHIAHKKRGVYYITVGCYCSVTGDPSYLTLHSDPIFLYSPTNFNHPKTILHSILLLPYPFTLSSPLSDVSS